MNSNSFSSRSVKSIFKNYMKCEHDFEAKVQRAKKESRVGENFFSYPKMKWKRWMETLMKVKEIFFIRKIKGI